MLSVWLTRIGFATLFVSVAFVGCKSDPDQPGNGSSGSSGFSGDGGPSTSGGPSSSSGKDGTAAPAAFVTTTDETMTFGGQTRQYILGKPKTYDAAKKYPLVLSFHGNPDTAKNQANSLPFDVWASKGDAVVVYPQSLDGQNWDLSPNANADGDWMGPLIDEIATKVNIDKTKVFGWGWSGGAFFLIQHTCRVGGQFKGIAAVAGGSPYGFPNQKPSGCDECVGGPIASILIRGAVDPVGDEYAAGCIAETNGCGDNTTDSTPTPCKAYPCAPDKAVKRCDIPERGHEVWNADGTAEWEGMSESWKFFTSLP